MQRWHISHQTRRVDYEDVGSAQCHEWPEPHRSAVVQECAAGHPVTEYDLRLEEDGYWTHGHAVLVWMPEAAEHTAAIACDGIITWLTASSPEEALALWQSAE